MSAPPQISPQVIAALLERESLALVGRLFKGLVHNISGAMQMVRLPLDLMELNLAKGNLAEAAKKFEILQQGMGRLQEELDLMGAKSSAMARPQGEPFDLWALAAEQLEFWRAELFFKHEVELDLKMPAGAGMASAGHPEAALAFNLLVSNGIESLSAAGSKRLKVRGQATPTGPGLLLWDDGPAPEDEVQARMFEAFFTTKGDGHAGLGLFLAREALRTQGGDLAWLPGGEGGFLMHLPGRQ